MYPIIIKIGPLTVYTYGMFVAAGFLLGVALAVREARRQGMPYERVADLGFYILLGAIVGSRLLYVMLNAGYFISRPLDIFKIWQGGLVFYGGLAAAVALAVWHMRRHSLPVWKTTDLFAPSLAVGHAIGRLGCFSAGCCYGRPAEGLPWAVTFTNPESLAAKGIPLHPTQIYESIGEFAIFLFLMSFKQRKAFDGQLILIYGMAYPVLRFIVEFWRGDEARGMVMPWMSVSQAVSIALFAATLVVYIRLSRRAIKNRSV